MNKQFINKRYDELAKMLIAPNTGKLRADIEDRRKDPDLNNMDDMVERLRRCPQCGKYFLTDNLNAIFCCEEHRKDYNHRIEREIKIDLKQAAPDEAEIISKLAIKRDAQGMLCSVDDTIAMLERLSNTWPIEVPVEKMMMYGINPEIFDEKLAIEGQPGSYALRYKDFYLCLCKKIIIISKIRNNEDN